MNKFVAVFMLVALAATASAEATNVGSSIQDHATLAFLLVGAFGLGISRYRMKKNNS